MLYLLSHSEVFKIFFSLVGCAESESESEVPQSCPTLCDPMDCSPPSSSVHGILQARILEWVAISFSRGSSRPRDRTQVSFIAGRCFNLRALVVLGDNKCFQCDDCKIISLGI